MECGIVNLVSAGLTVMTERLDYFTMHGVRVLHALVAVYDLDAEGKILSWREYFDTTDLGAAGRGGDPAAQDHNARARDATPDPAETRGDRKITRLTFSNT